LLFVLSINTMQEQQHHATAASMQAVCWKCSQSVSAETQNLIGTICSACYLSGSTSSSRFSSISTLPPKTELGVDDKRLQIILSVGEECVEAEELKALLASPKKEIICYDGFEPSGRMHIAQGLIRAINTNKLTSCGLKFKFWVADWFAWMNNKLGGDLKKIQKAGKLMIEVWRACGMNMENVEFLWSSEEINRNPNAYWSLVLDISTKFNLTRIKKCTQIMGRESSDDLAASQIFYPVMQCTDIFFLKADICSLGVDQRKVNMLAREYCDKVKRKFKPIILSHHMVMGLDGSDKMSKSKPDNAIFMDDEPAEVKRKINKAFCEPGRVDKNPLLEYAKYILFAKYEEVRVERDQANGGEVAYKSFEDMYEDFKAERLHPGDLKLTMIRYLNELLAPIQKHFEENAEAKKLLKTVKGYQITK